MFITAIALWLGVQGLQLSPGLIVATVFIDVIAWSSITSAFEAWATGERETNMWDSE